MQTCQGFNGMGSGSSFRFRFQIQVSGLGQRCQVSGLGFRFQVQGSDKSLKGMRVNIAHKKNVLKISSAEKVGTQT